jgi:hypothetical protein
MALTARQLVDQSHFFALVMGLPGQQGEVTRLPSGSVKALILFVILPQLGLVACLWVPPMADDLLL